VKDVITHALDPGLYEILFSLTSATYLDHFLRFNIVDLTVAATVFVSTLRWCTEGDLRQDVRDVARVKSRYWLLL
jgi:hypothetical protein